MGFRKPATPDELAALKFDADYLDDCLAGVMDFLEDNNVPTTNNDGETFIVIRNSTLGADGERTFTGAIYVGKNITDIKNDIQ